MKRAFTLLELIIVVLIISILAALVFPIYRAVNEKSKETVCKSQLHQIQVAIALYRTEHDGDGKYGRGDEMGLPPKLSTLVKSGLDPGLTKCKGDPSLLGGSEAVYMVMWAWPDFDFGHPKWATYAQEAREASILLIDPSHGNDALYMGTPYFTHNVLGVYLDGQVVRRSGKGAFSNRHWWNRQ